jgi:hypothetical protein
MVVLEGATMRFPFCLASIAALAGCPSDSEPDTRAADAFWTAFVDQRYDQLPEVTAGLEAAARERPGDPWAAELHAIAMIWRLAEAPRDPSLTPAQIPPIALAAEQELARAQQLLPSDPLILGRLGALQFAIGGVLHDPARIAQARAHIDRSVEQYPEFALFTRARLFFDLPAGDPSAAARVEDFWTKLDACAGETVDRAAYDLGKYVARATDTGPERVCWNTPHTPHGVEGFFVYMGDALVKQGDPATAKRMYASARQSPDYASWPFHAELDDRIASADAWAARFADGDPANDPPLITATKIACASCHAR